MKKAKDVDEYILDYPHDIQKLLHQLRTTIKKAVPKAEEVISYGMPAYKLQRVLVYFAGCKNHIGFYPTPSAIQAFKKELSTFKMSKGSVHFPLDKPLPLSLIANMVKFRAQEDALESKNKK